MARHILPDGIVIQGHILDSLASLPAESVQMCVTSPPYYGLRKYSGDQDTQWSNGFGAYGLERTPQEWADRTLEWLRAVRRVLRKDGTVWLNVGSSYAGGGNNRGNNSPLNEKQASNGGALGQVGVIPVAKGYKPLDLIDPLALLYPGLLADGWYVRSVVIWAKPNPMPESVQGTRFERHRVKTKAQATRNDNKKAIAYSERTATFKERYETGEGIAEYADCPGCPKCTPNDGLVLRRGSWRPTSSYEYVIMLAKSASYYSDGEGVREPAKVLDEWPGSWKRAKLGSVTDERTDTFHGETVPAAGRNLRDVWEAPEPVMRLRKDLSDADRAYVLGELLKRGL